jgi:hypothetical protein
VFLRSRNRIDELIATAREIRPDIDWFIFSIQSTKNDSREAIRKAVLNISGNENISISQFKVDDIEDFISDDREGLSARIRLLDIYISFGYRNENFFGKLAMDPFQEMRLTIVNYIYRNPDLEPPIRLNINILDSLLNERSDSISASAIRAIRNYVEIGMLPIEHLIIAQHHWYWLVKKIAIDYIVQVDAPNSLNLLYEFRDVGYHVSQQSIREYIRRRCIDIPASEHDLQKSIDIVKHFQSNTKTTDISRRKNEALLSELINRAAQIHLSNTA